MTKAEILASDMPAVEKVWAIASQRNDIGTGAYGVAVASLVYERFGNTCCAIGAVLVGEEREQNYTATAAGLLGVSEEWVEDFIDGFDGAARTAPRVVDGYAAGQEIRRRFEAMGVPLG